MATRAKGPPDAAYDRTTIALHWITATSVLVLWVIGQTADWIPDGPANTAYWSVHVVLGFVLAAVLAWRILWRTSGGRRLPAADPAMLHAFAKATHYLLYGLLLASVVLGVVNAFVRGYNLFDPRKPAPNRRLGLAPADHTVAWPSGQHPPRLGAVPCRCSPGPSLSLARSRPETDVADQARDRTGSLRSGANRKLRI